MAGQLPHGIAAVKVNATALGGIISSSSPINIQTENIDTDGRIDSIAQSIISMSPTATFATHAITAALALIGLDGFDCSTGAYLSLYAQAREDGGSRTAGSTHLKYTIKNGIAFPESLSVSQDGSAVLSYQVVAGYDGSNEPILITATEPLPAGTEGDFYGIGPVYLAGQLVAGVTGIDVNFGITAEPIFSDGDIRPAFVSITTRKPTITITTLNAPLFVSTIPITGLLGTALTTWIYLRKRAPIGGYVSDVTATHVKITASGIVSIDNAFSASGGAIGESTITVTPYSVAEAAPIVITSAAVVAYSAE